MYQDDHTSQTVSQGSYRTEWTEHEHPSTAVVEAVAEATGRDQTELDPLYEYLDGDNLDGLLRDADSGVTVSFTYARTRVEISASGPLAVRVES